MRPLLRAFGLLNAAIWFGAAVFFTLGVGPALFSPEVAAFLPRPQAGKLALVIIDRYFLLQYICAGVALLHLTAEWLLSGRPLPAARLTLVCLLLALGLVGGRAVQPRMRELHARAYDPQTPPAAAEAAMKSFRKMHGATQAANLVLMAGFLVHLLLIPAAGGRTADRPRSPG